MVPSVAISRRVSRPARSAVTLPRRPQPRGHFRKGWGSERSSWSQATLDPLISRSLDPHLSHPSLARARRTGVHPSKDAAAVNAPVTLLFTDLVNSTELLERVGDERAQRLLQAHHRLLKDTVAAHGGQEVKLLGDGLMTAFASAADAVRAAVTIQQAARRRAAGERLALRVGLHFGEAPREETDYFGTPVLIARRLCEQAQAGQILSSGIVVGLLAGRQAFRFTEVGVLALKGLAAPVTAYEVPYQQDDPTALLTQTPFVGRTAELAHLGQRLRDAHAGRGAVVLLEGEAGIGKTRTLEELAETARAERATVLWGRCYEGEAARPYGPFAEALSEYVRRAAAESLRADLGLGASALTRVVSELRERLPDLPEPVALQPEEERVRLLDAVVQFLLAL